MSTKILMWVPGFFWLFFRYIDEDGMRDMDRLGVLGFCWLALIHAAYSGIQVGLLVSLVVWFFIKG
jgi:hypothetical protein